MTFISGGLAFVLGVVFSVMSFALPDASIGIPYAPKVFPAGLGILMTFLSATLVLQEMVKIRKAEKVEGETDKNPYIKKIFLTCVFCAIYAILFSKAGYVISTILFLEAELWLFNGLKKWKTNTVIAVVYSLFIYIVFSKIFGVYLPLTPGIWI